MKKKNWIYALIVTLIIIIAIVSMIFFVQTKYGDQSEKGSQSVSNKNNKIHIAIVNEDQPTTYNGKKVELGQAFIKRLANEKNYKFETVTRNVAESGLKNGGYQVMIVIPENFSKLAMQLDAKTPSKISLQYKTAVGQKEEVAKNTEKVVSNVLNDFNKNLVEIYLTSIIDNLHNAQKNVGAIMTREHGVNSKFSNYLLNPINDFPELFTDTLVNSISANKDITKWFQTYNKSLLSANSDTFRVNTDYNVSTLIEKQNSLFDEHNTAMDKMLQDYKSQKDSVELDNYINALKAFMSNPVQKKNLENVLANNGNTEVISPTLFVLLMYLLSMITAYIFYSYERAKGQMNFIKDDYSSKNHLWNNVITSGVIGTTGLVEGLIVGLIAMNKFHVLAGYRAKFILMVILTMMVFVLINTYLLRQVKSIGMFLMIAALGLYFVAMNNLKAAGQGVTNKISPLSYIDNMFFNYLNAEHPIGLALVILTVLVIIGFVLNMFIKHFKKERLI